MTQQVNTIDAQQVDPIDIQYLLRKRGITQKELAEQAGVTEMTISRVIRFDMVSDRLFKVVANAINMDHRQVFAWYYNTDNKRRRKTA